VDDGLPAGPGVVLNWFWVSAPPAPALNGQGTARVSFTPSVSGTYRLRLSASDGALSSVVDIDVLVAEAAVLRVQALGASLTNGYGGQQSYRYPLWKLLLDAGAEFDYVGTLNTTDGGTPGYPAYRGRAFDRDHEGHSGFTTFDLAAGLPGWMLGYVPDVSLIHAGTNDLLFGGSAGPDNALAGLTQMVQRLRARNPQIRIAVAQIVPVDPSHPGWFLTGNYAGVPASVLALNSRLPAWAASISTGSSPVIVVDQYSGFDGRADTIDGIHPNSSGEAKLAQRWFSAIRGWF
jgi:lysophospholipase L1-like esterase